MVYCGKPSRGCQMCRTRRIKCDETKPTCNQCAKSRRQCPGYKDEFDLVFRNETQATERRARKATAKGAAARIDRRNSAQDEASPPSTAPPTPGSSSTVAQRRNVMPSLAVPVEERAYCHFITNFVLIPKTGTDRGFMDWLIPMMKQEGTESHLQSAFRACSLALLDNRAPPGAKLKEKTLMEYTKALVGTNSALRDPRQQRADSTLASVLLLGMFENISAKKVGMYAWGSHTEGAIQLVKARGEKQLRTPLGTLLFTSVRTQMCIHALVSDKPPVMDADWWTEDACRNSDVSQAQAFAIRAAEVRGEVARLMATLPRSQDGIEIMLDITRRAQMIDQEIVTWTKNLPEHWHARTIAWVDRVPDGNYATAEAYPGRVDIYSDFYITSVRNMARTTRLILASLIVRCTAWVCSPVDFRTTPEYATASRTCVETISDIIASIPCQLGWHHQNKNFVQGKSRVNPSQLGSGEEQTTRILAGYFATWPLMCVNAQDYTTDTQRAWLNGRLKFIGDELGIKYAHILNQVHIRIPSMLIRRDGQMALPVGKTHNFVAILSSKNQKLPTPMYGLNGMQTNEYLYKEHIERERASLNDDMPGQQADNNGHNQGRDCEQQNSYAEHNPAHFAYSTGHETIPTVGPSWVAT